MPICELGRTRQGPVSGLAPRKSQLSIAALWTGYRRSRKRFTTRSSVIEGFHTGDLVVGNIGSDTRAKYGIVGFAVNETDRIQSSAEPGTTLISQDTYRIVADRIVVGRKSQEQLKGLEGPRSLYQVKAITSHTEKH